VFVEMAIETEEGRCQDMIEGSNDILLKMSTGEF
jgi:hypothetical protein